MATFIMDSDFKRFFQSIKYYKREGPKPRFSFINPEDLHLEKKQSITDIICFCLMPNHFHFLLKQNRENGIVEFISKITNSYTKYFNMKNKRFGPLFQGRFKAVHIDSNEQLIHLSRYIHLNPLVSYVTKDLESYPWSSYPEYLGKSDNEFCQKKIILEQFPQPSDYKKFVSDQEDYGKELEKIKHQLIDQPKV